MFLPSYYSLYYLMICYLSVTISVLLSCSSSMPNTFSIWFPATAVAGSCIWSFTLTVPSILSSPWAAAVVYMHSRTGCSFWQSGAWNSLSVIRTSLDDPKCLDFSAFSQCLYQWLRLIVMPAFVQCFPIMIFRFVEIFLYRHSRLVMTLCFSRLCHQEDGQKRIFLSP